MNAKRAANDVKLMGLDALAELIGLLELLLLMLLLVVESADQKLSTLWAEALTS